MDLDRRERLQLTAWAVGLWLLVSTFFGLVMFQVYTVPDGLFNWFMLVLILLGLLASQPSFVNFRAKVGELDREPFDRVPALMRVAGALVVLSVPAQAIVGIESPLWMRANTLAAGVVVFRIGQKLEAYSDG